MTPETVATLIAEIEAGDPLNFAGLSVDADSARLLMAAHFCDIDRQLVELGLGPDQRLEMMAAIAAHSMVENMLLHVSRLRGASDVADFRAWMQRHGIAGG